MAFIYDGNQKKKLKDLGINIKTKYIVGNNILERNSDDSFNDDIFKGIRCCKQYFINNKLVLTENKFDSRIEYTFISKELENRDYKCPNCGFSAKLHSFIDGCPYCRTHYNIDYIDKDLGGKYHYDRILRSTKYRVITAIIDIIFSIMVSFIFIKFTSRTFNSYDITKIFVYGIILSLILYYFFYVIDGYIVLGPIKRIKDKQNSKQIEFWKRTNIDKVKFYNNLNYEVRNLYFSKSDIIDYDIIDYDDFNDKVVNGILCVEVKAYVRIIRYVNGKLKSEYIEDTYVMKKVNSDILEIKDGVNYIKCSNCCASIDAKLGKCSYCNMPIKALNEWIIE